MVSSNVDTILINGYIVTLYSDIVSNVVTIVWGTVEEDFTHGWIRGDFACTTEILNRAGMCFYTKNSIYRFTNEPQCIELPITSLQALRAGVDPQILLMQKETGGELTILGNDINEYR